jgi:hypothetical protein
MKAPIVTGSTTMGALCAAAGALTAVVVLASETGAEYEGLLLAAPAAAFVGTTPWWLLMERGDRSGTVRRVLTGAIPGGIAHYPCWLLLFLLESSACNVITGERTDSLGEAPMHPLRAVPTAEV